MSNELKHASVGTELTQTEFEAGGLHVLDGQTAGDMIIAASAGQLSRHPYTGRNAVINGCGIVDQRAADYTLVKDAYGIRADRFYGMATGTAVSAGVLTKTTTANCGITGHAFKFSGVTLTGAGIICLRYRMEAKDAVRFKNRTASFSCKLYHDAGNAINYTIYIRKANTADTFAAVTEIANSGAISVASAAETILEFLAVSMGDCSNGIEIEIKAACGAVTTKNFEFTECQFEPGSLRTNFEFRPFQQELALCQRYYFQQIGTNSINLESCGGTGTYNNQLLRFPVDMRIAPSVTLVGTFSCTNCATPTVQYVTTGKCSLQAIASGTMPVRVGFNSGADSGIKASAEL